MTRQPTGKPGYRVGLAGASSLLGQEILRVLKERGLAISRLSTFEAEEEEPDLPVLDLSEGMGFEASGEEDAPGSLDLLIFAARPRSKAGETSLLGRALIAAGLAADSSASPSSHCLVIDAAGALGKMPGAPLSVPRLEGTGPATPSTALSQVRVSPHPAAIVLSTLLLRLAARFAVKNCVAQVFFPASEIGPRAIDELQKQTLNLLTFQKIPEKVYGAQLAFNVLPRLPGKHNAELNELDIRVRHQLRRYLGDRVPMPALQLCQVAVFYSLAFSVFVEFDQPAAAEALTAALAGEGTSVRRHNEAAPSPIEAAGSGEILLDAVVAGRDRPNGCWIWAAVDNIRLAAENAADIALKTLPHFRRKQ